MPLGQASGESCPQSRRADDKGGRFQTRWRLRNRPAPRIKPGTVPEGSAPLDPSRPVRPRPRRGDPNAGRRSPARRPRLLRYRERRDPGRCRRKRRGQVDDRQRGDRPARPARAYLGWRGATWNGQRIDNLSPTRTMRQHARQAEIGMIFQDPLTSLNPLDHRSVTRSPKPCLAHLDVTRVAEARDRALAALEEVGIPAARAERLDSLSAPVLGRDAPAGGDRARPLRRAVACDRRRTDHGARRFGSGADRLAAPKRLCRERGTSVMLDHARYGRDRRSRRPCRGPLCRAGWPSWGRCAMC